MMIKIEAMVREEKFEDVKAALDEIGVNGLTVSQVMGVGIQRGYKEIVRGMQVDMQMQPKIKFEIVVSSEEWEQKTIDAIQKAAYTGEARGSHLKRNLGMSGNPYRNPCGDRNGCGNEH